MALYNQDMFDPVRFTFTADCSPVECVEELKNALQNIHVFALDGVRSYAFDLTDQQQGLPPVYISGEIRLYDEATVRVSGKAQIYYGPYLLLWNLMLIFTVVIGMALANEGIIIGLVLMVLINIVNLGAFLRVQRRRDRLAQVVRDLLG